MLKFIIQLRSNLQTIIRKGSVPVLFSCEANNLFYYEIWQSVMIMHSKMVDHG